MSVPIGAPAKEFSAAHLTYADPALWHFEVLFLYLNGGSLQGLNAGIVLPSSPVPTNLDDDHVAPVSSGVQIIVPEKLVAILVVGIHRSPSPQQRPDGLLLAGPCRKIQGFAAYDIVFLVAVNTDAGVKQRLQKHQATGNIP